MCRVPGGNRLAVDRRGQVRYWVRWVTAACVCLLALGESGFAVIFFATGDPNHNTTAPAGDLADSGWQLQGRWGGFLGTPIASKYFLTARHIGGAIGDLFEFRGVFYRTSGFFDTTNSDLRLWRVCGTFPDWAPLFAGTNEPGKALVVFGRGTLRGDPVVLTNGPTPALKGWYWGPYDGTQRWGQNVVDSVVNGDDMGGTTGIGDLLAATFDQSGVVDECHLSVGDSGGAVFLQDGSVWKLAGINYSVDGPYNTSTNGDGFNAALFDQGGLYQRDGEAWTFVPESGHPQPGAFYASRVSSNLEWIQSVLAEPVPSDDRPVLQSAAVVGGPYQDEDPLAVDEAAQTITIAQPNTIRFYRLRACGSLTIRQVGIEGGQLVLRYE